VILSLQFSGGDGDLDEFRGDLAREHPAESIEDLAWRLVEGVLDLAQFLTLMTGFEKPGITARDEE
jgi:hypothetical protein